jgi:peptidoglycan/xylan/chitin deacetylase (PgdA/CDA1 family)
MDLRRAGLDAIWALRLHKVLRPPAGRRGVIFSAHRVQPVIRDEFQPNRNLTITPEFLEAAILCMRDAGYDLVHLDEVHERLTTGARKDRPFAAFTFDDGYRDNLVWAYPVLARHNVPFTVFVPSKFADGEGVLWWELLERVIRSQTRLKLQGEVFEMCDAAAKLRSFARAVQILDSIPPAQAHALVSELASLHGIDAKALCREIILGWDELRDWTRDPLVNIGGHTVNHYQLSRLSSDEAQAEIAGGLDQLQERLGSRPRHFSYPFGDPSSAGERDYRVASSNDVSIAVTTINEIIADGNCSKMTALPRMSLNRAYDDVKYLELLASGIPKSLGRLFRF